MNKVVSIEEARPDPYISGEAHCLACYHLWQAVAPVGVTELECPECGNPRGVWRNPLAPAEGHQMFVCNCGCEYFYILDSLHAQCTGCAVVTPLMEFFDHQE